MGLSRHKGHPQYFLNLGNKSPYTTGSWTNTLLHTQAWRKAPTKSNDQTLALWWAALARNIFSSQNKAVGDQVHSSLWPCKSLQMTNQHFIVGEDKGALYEGAHVHYPFLQASGRDAGHGCFCGAISRENCEIEFYEEGEFHAWGWGAAWVDSASDGKIWWIPAWFLAGVVAAGGLGSIMRSRVFCSLSLGWGWLILCGIGTLLLCRLYRSLVQGFGSYVQKRVPYFTVSWPPWSPVPPHAGLDILFSTDTR